MSDLFVTRENNYNLRKFQELESSFKQTVKFGTETISYRGLQIWSLISERNKKEIKKGSVQLVHVECAKHTFNVLALLTKNSHVFSLGRRYSNTTCFSIFMNRNFSRRIHTADIISL